MDNIDSDLKGMLRQQALEDRNDFVVDGERARELSSQVCSNIVEHVRKLDIGTIGIYWPIRSEVDVRYILVDLMQEGWRIALPCVIAEGQPMIFREWQPDTDLVPGYMDILEPSADTSEVLMPDVVLVPLAAFDREGGRLGYGGGFYDRTIQKWAEEGRSIPTIGCAYSIQEVAKVPMETHDVPIDMIVTEKEVIRFT